MIVSSLSFWYRLREHKQYKFQSMQSAICKAKINRWWVQNMVQICKRANVIRIVCKACHKLNSQRYRCRTKQTQFSSYASAVQAVKHTDTHAYVQPNNKFSSDNFWIYIEIFLQGNFNDAIRSLKIATMISPCNKKQERQWKKL